MIGPLGSRHGARVGYLVALAGVCVVSLFIGLVVKQVNLANSSMLYLLAVMATALAFGRGPAIFASFTAFLVFDYFFVQPLYQFTVSDPDEWLSLMLFLLTATVTGQLAGEQRRRAHDAFLREREAVVLYDVVRLLGEPDLNHVLGRVAERLRRELQLEALIIELAQPTGEVQRFTAGAAAAIARADGGLRTRVMHASRSGAAGEDDAHAAPGRWVRIVRPSRSSAPAERDDLHLVPIRVGDTRVGDLLLIGPADGDSFDRTEDRLVSAAAAQIGVAIDRARLREEATQAELLQRTDALRRALLNAVSHDLRTPLATIMASAGSLRQNDVAWTDAERQGFTQAIEQEAARLNRLVGNLLDLSRIEAGSLQPQKSWQDVETLIDDVLERLRSVTRNHRVRVVLPGVPIAAYLDPVEIGEVLYNLVENAAKYSPSGTEILIEADVDSHWLSLSVSDRGPGVPAAALPYLFAPFYRVIDGRPRAQGLGLGLAIVKGLVDAHHGRVFADNRDGGGARFALALPVADDGAPLDANGLDTSVA